MWWLAAVAFIGSTISNIGAYAAAKARAEDLDERAEIKSLQTKEVIFNLRRNKGILNTRAKKAIGSQQAALAKSGIALGTGSALTLQDEILDEAQLVLFVLDREATLTNKRLRRESASLRSAAEATRRAGKINLLSGFISGGSNSVKTGLSGEYDPGDQDG